MKVTFTKYTRMVGWLTLLTAAFLHVPAIYGHSMYQSAVLLDFHQNTVGAELELPVDRLSIAFKQIVDEKHLDAERSALSAYVLNHVHPVADDGRPFHVILQSLEVQIIERAPYLVVRLLFTPPPNSSVNHFVLNYDVITHQIVTHVVLVSIRSDDRTMISSDDPVLLGIIRGSVHSVVVDRSKHV